VLSLSFPLPCVLLLLAFKNRVSSVRSPGLHFANESRTYFTMRIVSVHAGAENRTAIHLQPFRALCQPIFFGFHRFFPVFLGFVRNVRHFSAKKPNKQQFLSPVMATRADKKRRRQHDTNP
jgi:hypothetical protein